jgi:hypothetical protein
VVSGLGRWERYREYHYAPPTSFLVVLTTISTWRYRGIVVSWQWDPRLSCAFLTQLHLAALLRYERHSMLNLEPRFAVLRKVLPG